MSLPARIVIDALELHAFHGWLPHEREFGQHFRIDLEIDVDIARVAETDDLADALDYGAVVASTRRMFVAQPRRLIETVAVAVLRGLLAEFPAILAARIRVAKLAPPLPDRMGYAAVDVKLSRDA